MPIFVRKLKVKVDPEFNKAPRHEEVGGSGDMAPLFLTSTLDGAIRLLHSGESTYGTHWIVGWVGHSVCLDAVEQKKKSIASAWGQIPAVQPIVYLYTN